jgi:three-Cys-motif partner protein
MSALIDSVGPWTEVKVEIVREYAQVFRKITSARSYFHTVYMDGFSGSGILLSKQRGEPVAGTPARIIAIEPRFNEYHFIEKRPKRQAVLRAMVGSHPNVTVHEGDSNVILLENLLPTMTYESYRKGLLFLDPYGLHLDWKVVEAAGKSRCVDLLLNFPIHDINRRVLWKDPARVAPSDAARMTRFCGSEDWGKDAYRAEPDLFGNVIPEKVPGNEPIVRWYTKRLHEVASFEHVSAALPMKNETKAVVYYLIGASQAKQGVDVFNSVFRKWRKRGVRIVAAEHD